MVDPGKDFSSSSRTIKGPADDQSNLADLRESLAAVAKDIASLAERRAKSAQTSAMGAAEAGVEQLRGSIRRQPVLAMAAAAAAGIALALAIAPRSGARSSSWDRLMPAITRADLYDMAENLQRSLSRAAGAAAAPITPAFERMLDTVSRTDASSINTILSRIGEWFQKTQEKTKQKTD